MILQTDSYKVTHWAMYPKGMTKMKAYFSSRGGKFDSTISFGLQVSFCNLIMSNLFKWPFLTICLIRTIVLTTFVQNDHFNDLFDKNKSFYTIFTTYSFIGMING